MKWLADSGNMKKVSLPPSSWPWRNCPGRSSKSKRVCPNPNPHLYGPVSQLLGVSVPLQERGHRGYPPQGTLWFYLHEHREDMRKWDAKPTSTLEARVCELEGKPVTKWDSARKNATPVSSGQLSRQGRQFCLTSDPLEGTSQFFLQEMSNKYSDQD